MNKPFYKAVPTERVSVGTFYSSKQSAFVPLQKLCDAAKPCGQRNEKAERHAADGGNYDRGKHPLPTAAFTPDSQTRCGTGPVHQRKKQRAERRQPGPPISGKQLMQLRVIQ